MPQTCWFLDWCATPTVPWISEIAAEEIPIPKVDGLDNSAYLPEIVKYWRRVDGLILFSAIFASSEDPTGQVSDSECIRLASFIGQQIKARIGEQNAALSATVTEIDSPRGGFPTISISPIKLSSSVPITPTDRTIAGADAMTPALIMQSDTKLMKLMAVPAGNRQGNEIRALYLLRSKFSSAFGKAYGARAYLKQIKWRFGRKRGKGWGIDLFRRYTWHGPVYAYVCLVLLLASFNLGKYARALQTETPLPDLAMRVALDFLNWTLILGLPLLAIIYITVIRVRRRSTIRAVDKAIEVLLLGNIYCQTLRRIAISCGQNDNDTDFSDSIDLLREFKSREIEKRNANLRWIAFLSAICAVPFFKFIDQFPFWHAVKEIVFSAFSLPFM